MKDFIKNKKIIIAIVAVIFIILTVVIFINANGRKKIADVENTEVIVAINTEETEEESTEEVEVVEEVTVGVRHHKDKFIKISQKIYFVYLFFRVSGTNVSYFAQARRYDAGAGRFVSEDFLKGHIAVPYTMNHYSYCWNRPMDLVDLNGMWPSLKDIGKGIKNAASSAANAVKKFHGNRLQ